VTTTTEVTTTDVAITTAGATTVNHANKKSGASSAAFLCPDFSNPKDPPEDGDLPKPCGNAPPPPHPAHY
jgi:hypothetical protein